MGKKFNLLKIGFFGHRRKEVIMKFAYLRASTSQERQDLSRQYRFAHNNGVEDENIFKEYASGGKIDRIEFNRLLKTVENSSASSKEIYFSSVDRATRSLKQLINLIEWAKENHIKLVFGEFVIDCRNTLSAFTQGQLLMIGLVSELTRIFIVENVKDGLATAREAGRIGGQPKLTTERIFKKNPDFARYYIDYKQGKYTKKELGRLCCVCRNTITNWIHIIETKQ